MIRNFFLVGLLLIPASAKAEFASTATYSGLSFRRVGLVGASERNVNFYFAYINSKLMNITVDLDNVEVCLSAPNSLGLITTLEVIDAKSDALHDWLSARKVVIQVRSAGDLDIWNNFLKKAKVERENWRRNMRQPSRILPPKE